MGRLLEALSQPDARRPVPSPASAPSVVVESGEDEVPFIEIGGPPRTRPLPSAANLPSAASATQSPQPPQPPQLPQPLHSQPAVAPTPTVASAPSPTPAAASIASTASVAAVAVKPLTIHFQPLPADALLGALRDAQVSTELIAYHQPDHAVSGQYRRLAEQLRAQLEQAEPRAILLCGAGRCAGTTTVALNLAVTLALAGERVAVLDANLQRPAVAAKLGIANTPGLAEVLTRRAPLPWALRSCAVEGLHVLPCPGGVAFDAQAIARLAAVVDGLRAKHDWVIVDAGVVGQGQEWAVLTAACEATYFVLRQEDVDAPELTSVQAQVETSGGQLRGYVLTQA